MLISCTQYENRVLQLSTVWFSWSITCWSITGFCAITANSSAIITESLRATKKIISVANTRRSCYLPLGYILRNLRVVHRCFLPRFLKNCNHLNLSKIIFERVRKGKEWIERMHTHTQTHEAVAVRSQMTLHFCLICLPFYTFSFKLKLVVICWLYA